MSFGVSVGDFIAVGALIVKIVDALHGIRSEYQELIRELESLGRALSQVDKLKGRGDQAVAIDQIKCAALTCRYPLEEFLAKIQKYEKSLGLGKSVGKIKVAGRKMQYAFGKKDEANTLRNYLNIHIGTINMLLLRQGLEMLDVSSEQTDKNQEELRDKIDDSSRELREVGGNVEAQTLAVRENNSIIQKLFWMVSGDIAAPLKSLSQTVAKVCVSTQQIYTIVLELRASLPGIDTRFTYFQAPVRVEDALGRVFPFSSECSLEALNAEIKARFKEGPGKTEVMAGDFEMFDAKNTDHLLTISGRNVLLPGMSINMAIVLEKEFTEGDKCPMPHCASKTFVEAVGGGRTCSGCKVWFDGASKKRKRDFEGEQISKHVKTLADRNRNQAKRPKTLHPDLQEASGSSDEEKAEIDNYESEETSISAFKRIRFDTGLQGLAIEELIKLIDLKRDQIPYSDVQLRELLEKMRSRWRPPWDDELYVMKAFARHASHCSACAHPYEVHRKGGKLCSKGHQRALDVAQYVFKKAGQIFSVVDLEGNRRVQMEIPVDCAVVRELLKATELGLRIRRDPPLVSYDKIIEYPQEPTFIERGSGPMPERRYIRKPLLQTAMSTISHREERFYS